MSDLEKLIRLSALELYKNLFPKNRIYCEFDPFRMKFVKKANCPRERELNFPTMYFYHEYFACYSCGHKGSAFLLYQGIFQDRKAEEFIRYWCEIKKINLSGEEIKKAFNFFEEESIHSEDLAEQNLAYLEKGTAHFSFYSGGKEEYKEARKRTWNEYFKAIYEKIRKIKLPRFTKVKQTEYDLPF